jgi:hypothetical protein
MVADRRGALQGKHGRPITTFNDELARRSAPGCSWNSAAGLLVGLPLALLYLFYLDHSGD